MNINVKVIQSNTGECIAYFDSYSIAGVELNYSELKFLFSILQKNGIRKRDVLEGSFSNFKFQELVKHKVLVRQKDSKVKDQYFVDKELYGKIIEDKSKELINLHTVKLAEAWAKENGYDVVIETTRMEFLGKLFHEFKE
jgi:hypothetical protein